MGLGRCATAASFYLQLAQNRIPGIVPVKEQRSGLQEERSFGLGTLEHSQPYPRRGLGWSLEEQENM